MIYIVDAENRELFDADLSAMHRHRKSTFVDHLGWQIPVFADQERDAYDREDTRYLIARARSGGPLLASARLLPTAGPHLMSDLFAHTCRDGAPTGATVWEASRFCTAPHLRRRERLDLLWQIFCGILETALLHDLEQIIFTANRALLPLALRAGWRARTLGPSFADGRDTMTAVGIDVDLSGFERCAGALRSKVLSPASSAPSGSPPRRMSCPSMLPTTSGPLGLTRSCCSRSIRFVRTDL